MNSIGHGILQDCSGCLVQRSEQFTALQKRRAAQNRDVHLTVISCQLGQQVRFKGGPQQTTGHTWRRLEKSVSHGAETGETERGLLSSPPSSVYTSYNLILCLCRYASNHQQLQVSEQTYASLYLQLLQACHTGAVFHLHPQFRLFWEKGYWCRWGKL